MANGDELYYETYREDDAPDEGSPVGKLLKTVSRVFLLLLVAAVMILLFWRFWTMKEPKNITAFLWTEKALASDGFTVYTQNLDATYLVEKTDENTGNVSAQYVKRSEYYPYNDGVEGSERSDYEGTFKVTSTGYSPELGQFQLTFRYNSRLLEKLLRASYGIFADSGIEGYPLTLALEDESGRIVGEYSYIEGDRSFYHYRRIVFENVSLEIPPMPYYSNAKMYDDYNAANGKQLTPGDAVYRQVLYLNIYYNGKKLDYKEPYASMVVFDGHLACTEVKLPKPPKAAQTVMTFLPEKIEAEVKE